MSNTHLALFLLVLLAVPAIGRLSEERKRRRYYRQMMQRYGYKLLAAADEAPEAKPVEPAQY